MSAATALLLEASGDGLRFLGRLHPLLVHLPIGGLFALLLAEVLLGARPEGRALALRRGLVLLFAAGAAGAALAGWLLAEEGGYETELLAEHRRQGLIAAGLAAALLLSEAARQRAFGTLLRRALLLLAAGMVAVAGHHGGALTHGASFLARYAPAALRPWLQEEAEPAAARVASRSSAQPDGGSGSVSEKALELSNGGAQGPTSAAAGSRSAGLAAAGIGPAGSGAAGLAAEVRRLMDGRCVECHGPDKQKGGLRLDTPGGLARAVLPGDPAGSELFLRVTLPADDEDRMPTEGEPLSADQIGLLYAWIRAGAPLEDGPTGNGSSGDGPTEAGPRSASEASAGAAVADLAAADLRLLAGSGARFEALPAPSAAAAGPAQGSRAWSLDFARSGAPASERRLDPRALAALAPLSERIAELDLSGCRGLGAALAAAPPLPGLRRLSARGSDLDDAALALLLERAPALETLVLTGSPISAASSAALAAAAALETLYLAETQFGASDLAALQARCPRLAVIGSLSLPADPLADDGPRRLWLADASTGRLALLRETALEHYELLFEHPIQQLHDLQVLPDGALLFQTDWQTLVEIDPSSGERRWSYDARRQNRPAGEAEDAALEVHSFERLADGSTLIAESGRRRLIWVDREGRLLHQVALRVDRPDAHHDTRLVRTTPTGTVLVAHEADGVVREYDRDGQVVWSYAVPLFGQEARPGHGPSAHGNQVFGAWRLADGRTRIATGNGHRVLEVDREGRILWEFGPADLPQVALGWITSVQELPSGHLVITNCHAGPDQPQLIEIDRDKRLIWSFRDFKRFGDSLSNAWIVPDPRRDGPAEGPR
jgi:uncharacterized membrane protein/outer membrane protein assembly factor BamB